MIDLQKKKRIGLTALRRRLGKVQLPVALGMTVVWMLLFDAFRPRWESLGLLLLGFVVSVLIMLLFPLPPISPGFGFRPLNTLRLVAYVLTHMVMASFQVTMLTFRPGQVCSSVVAVRLRTDSDLITVCAALASSIIPGTVVVEVAAEPERIIYVHVLGADDEESIEAAREDILRLEERIVMALGTREDVDAVRAGGDREPERRESA